MKTFLLLTLLALVACSYAAPTSNLAAVDALLNNLNDAQLESLLNVQAQDVDDDDRIAQIEAMLQDAKFQSWFRDAISKVKDIGKKAYSGIKTVAENPMVREIGKQLLSTYLPADAQNDDDNNVAALMAMIQDNDDESIAEIEALLQDARFQSWFKDAISKVKDIGKKAYSGIKTVAKNPMVREIGKQLLSTYLPVDAQNDDDNNVAALMAMMQDNDDDESIAEIEAMLQDARFQSWFTDAISKVKDIGKKAYSGIKTVAKNPMVREIGKQLLSTYLPADAQNDDDNDVAALMAMMQDNNDDESIAEIEAMLQDARFQSWFTDAISKVKDIGKKAYSGIKTVANNPMVREIGKQLLSTYLPADAQNDDDNDVAALMAMMQDNNDDESIAEIEAMLQDARFQSWFKDAISKVKDIGKKAYSGIKTVAENPMVREIGKQLLSTYLPADAQNDDDNNVAALMAMMQDNDDDESIAEIEAMLQDARFQSWFTDAISKVKDIGKKAYSGIKTVAKNPMVREIGKQLLSTYLPADVQNDDDNDVAALMAMMQDNDDDESIAEIEAMLQDVRFQSWFKDAISKVKDIGKKAYSGIKTVAENPMVREIGKQLLSTYLPADAQNDDDNDVAALMAMMQNNDDESIAEIEAMLQDARFQSWFKDAISKVKDIGKKVYSGIKTVAENPMVREIGKQLLSTYLPADAQEDDSIELEKILQEALKKHNNID
ncbi:uncharacterized protein LOC135335816 [Halichondria panicea]|uniref:uncharacterized protein LOC135335816 n=1 Tax=Halichondria panicea TaxID=6063 RepID=UPI00312B9944